MGQIQTAAIIALIAIVGCQCKLTVIKADGKTGLFNGDNSGLPVRRDPPCMYSGGMGVCLSWAEVNRK